MRLLPPLSCTLLFFFTIPSAFAHFAVTRQSLFSVVGEPEAGLSGEAAAGVNLVGGNTQTSRYELRQRTTYRWSEETVQLQLRYLEGSANDVQNAKNWGTGLRYERRLLPHTGGFAGHTLEADRFAGYRQRHSTDVGLRRVLWDRERSAGAIEAGYRHQIEKRTDDTSKVSPIVRVYSEARYRINAQVSTLLLLELLPEVNDSTNWMVNAETSLEAGLTPTWSLKTAYGVKYDNVPAEAGRRKTDRSLVTALTARF